MNNALLVSDWLQIIALGAVTGAVGQLIRQIASLKKILENNVGDRMSVALDQTRVVINLLIGAVAGTLGAVSMSGELTSSKGISPHIVLSLIGFGYAGADFIESFMRRAEAPKEQLGMQSNLKKSSATTPGSVG